MSCIHCNELCIQNVRNALSCFVSWRRALYSVILHVSEVPLLFCCLTVRVSVFCNGIQLSMVFNKIIAVG